MGFDFDKAILEARDEEIDNLRCLLWAAIKSYGGQLTIADCWIKEYNAHKKWKRFNDSVNGHIRLYTDKEGE